GRLATQKQRMTARLSWLLICAAGIAVLPMSAFAITDSTDWQTSSTMAPLAEDDATGVVVNVKTCRDFVEDGGTHTFTFTREATAGVGSAPRYSVKVAAGNGQCNVDSLTLEPSETCYLAVENEDLAAAGNPLTVIVDMDRLTSAK